MNADELADIQAFKTEELTMWERNHTATMLRQQQSEIEALKAELVRYADALGEERGNMGGRKSGETVNLFEQSIEEAILIMRDSIDENRISKKPTMLLVYPPYLKLAMRIMGLIKQPIKRSASMRKKKRNLYWREKV